MPIGTFLNGRALTKLTGLQWLALSDVGQILSQVSTSDTGGGATQVWSVGTAPTWGTAIPCRIVPLSGRESIFGGRLSDDSSHVVQCPPGLAITPRDRFAITNRGTFEVTAVRTRTAEQAKFFEVTEIS